MMRDITFDITSFGITFREILSFLFVRLYLLPNKFKKGIFINSSDLFEFI